MSIISCNKGDSTFLGYGIFKGAFILPSTLTKPSCFSGSAFPQWLLSTLNFGLNICLATSFSDDLKKKANVLFVFFSLFLFYS